MNSRQKELQPIERLLGQLGFALERHQPHISGERFLMSPNKMVLVGKRVDDKLRVIIKVSRIARGRLEIKQEKRVRDALTAISVPHPGMFFPQEIYYGKRGAYVLLITEYIRQNRVFIAYALDKQFKFVRQSLQTRESIRVASLGQSGRGRKVLPVLRTKDYLEGYKAFQASALRNYQTRGIEEAMQAGLDFLAKHKAVMNKFSKYLVHSDFVPHNFRIRDNKVYILDAAAFHFGNKYEELARLLNYLVVHNPALEQKLLAYVSQELSKSDYLDLKLMRVYKLGFLLQYHTQALAKTSGDLLALTIHRIEFWEEVLRSVLHDKSIDTNIVQVFIENRDNLRSTDEIARQKEFALV